MIPGDTALKRCAQLAGATLAAALLAVVPASAETFTDTTAFSIPQGMSEPSPDVEVTGLAGPVTDVDVTLKGLSHAKPDDIDLMLISPSGTGTVLMSDACGSTQINNATVTFDQAAAAALPDSDACSTGSYRPADYEPTEMWENPPDYPSLDGFNGEVANGFWRLVVQDDDPMATNGEVAGGFSITITTAGTPPITISSGNQAFGPATPFPAELEVLGSERVILTDLDVLLTGVTHQSPEDIDMYLEGPGGQRSWLISDGCPGEPAKLLEWKADDEAPNAFNPVEPCSSNAYKPANYDDGGPDLDEFPAPGSAPAETATSLAAFDLTDPDGTWKLWVMDDAEGNAGFLAGGWSLEMDTRLPADVSFAVAAQTAPEGSSVTVDVKRSAGAAALGAGSIVIATTSGTAQAGEDFVPMSQTLSFGPGETTKSVTVEVKADGGTEPEQGFSIMLGQSEGDAKAGTPAALGVTIPADASRPADDIPTGNEDKPAPAPFTAKNVLASAPRARRCFRRGARIQFRPQMPAGVAVLRSEVFVNGRRIEDNIGEAAVAPILLTMSGKRMRVRIRLHAHDKRTVTINRTFRGCARRRPR